MNKFWGYLRYLQHRVPSYAVGVEELETNPVVAEAKSLRNLLAPTRTLTNAYLTLTLTRTLTLTLTVTVLKENSKSEATTK